MDTNITTEILDRLKSRVSRKDKTLIQQKFSAYFNELGIDKDIIFKIDASKAGILQEITLKLLDYYMHNYANDTQEIEWHEFSRQLSDGFTRMQKGKLLKLEKKYIESYAKKFFLKEFITQLNIIVAPENKESIKDWLKALEASIDLQKQAQIAKNEIQGATIGSIGAAAAGSPVAAAVGAAASLTWSGLIAAASALRKGFAKGGLSLYSLVPTKGNEAQEALTLLIAQLVQETYWVISAYKDGGFQNMTAATVVPAERSIPKPSEIPTKTKNSLGRRLVQGGAAIFLGALALSSGAAVPALVLGALSITTSTGAFSATREMTPEERVEAEKQARKDAEDLAQKEREAHKAAEEVAKIERKARKAAERKAEEAEQKARIAAEKVAQIEQEASKADEKRAEEAEQQSKKSRNHHNDFNEGVVAGLTMAAALGAALSQPQSAQGRQFIGRLSGPTYLRR